MKWLVGVACVAIIAAVANYFWGEYGQYKLRVEREKELAGIKAELFKLAGAEPGDTAKIVAWCKSVDDRKDGAMKDNPYVPQILTNCRNFGYL